MSVATEVAVERLDVAAYTIPTDRPESDGTMQWDSTTIVVVHAHAGGETGLGYTYAPTAAGKLIEEKLAEAVQGKDAFAVTTAWEAMGRALRNAGRPGIGSEAIAAVDTALWDLKARLLGLPLCRTLDMCRDQVPIYGSGGFTSYSDDELAEQLGGWAQEGIPRVKMKVGREPHRDLQRVRVAREAIGEDTELFVDANGAYTRKEAVRFARAYEEVDVRWFEEPVSSDDVEGLRLVRDATSIDVAAGEYGYMLPYFQRLLDAGAVDCLQADVTRCEGISGFLRVDALAQARSLDLSAHCGPAIHLHPCCAAVRLRHLEYFHDHVRIERLLFDGIVEPEDGVLKPDLSRAGNGLQLKRAEAERYVA